MTATKWLQRQQVTATMLHYI